MDLESGKDDLSIEDGNLLVYTRIVCRVGSRNDNERDHTAGYPRGPAHKGWSPFWWREKETDDSLGLDAVSSMSVARALLTIARSGRTVACVVHQPSSKLFTTADDVIVLAEGKTLYAGSIEASSYAHEMSRIARYDAQNKNGKGASPEAEALLLSPYKAPCVGYLASYWQQFCALLWRSCIGALRDVHLTQTIIEPGGQIPGRLHKLE
ncbi:Abc transporter [Operophtera brumata]|uniref:Abc transporter n=1 Tax=Operophtera brumata TaxID=104452 RepID=A0A0L7L5U6_OPEBR|nr:Abc transporter [Operophtera brumata]